MSILELLSIEKRKFLTIFLKVNLGPKSSYRSLSDRKSGRGGVERQRLLCWGIGIAASLKLQLVYTR